MTEGDRTPERGQEADVREAMRRAMEHLIELFVTPEVRRRQDLGELPRPLPLHAAQVIFFPDARKTEVRINEEVRAIGKVKLKAGPAREIGDPIYENDIEDWQGLCLAESDDPDCAHATFALVGDTWLFSFDFTYNRGLSKMHIQTAEEFIEAAEFSLSHGNWRAFVDTLFSAAELLAKASLLTHWAIRDFREKTNHDAIHARYNRVARIGNVDEKHVSAFNKLSRLRYPARYLQRPFSVNEADARDLLSAVKAMRDEARRLAGLGEPSAQAH